jgi:hypothetical protein
LDNVYDYYETQGQSAIRLSHENFTSWEYTRWTTPTVINVDSSVDTLRIVVASKQGDYDDYYSGARNVEILMPGGGPRDWIMVSPADPQTPVNWDIRNSIYDDVVIIPDPAVGTWQVRSNFNCTICGKADGISAQVYDVMINSSAQSAMQFTARFLPPIVNNQGAAGDYVPIVATLLNQDGGIPGAVVGAVIERPGGSTDLLLLWDDGLHNDGLAGDGIYGEIYHTAIFAGNYNVRLICFVYDSMTGNWVTREWNGGFYMTIKDSDGDLMPDDWELRCGLNPNDNDAAADIDKDGLANLVEYILGTLPCKADTDDGGENDGSEINGSRNPLFAPDDTVRRLGHVSVIALNENIRIQWTYPISYTNMVVWVSTVPGEIGDQMDMGNSGIYTVTNVTNDLQYYIRVAGQNGDAWGDYSDVFPVIPKADPDAPSGAIIINDGAQETFSKDVILTLSSDDTPLPGFADPASSRSGGTLGLLYNEISAGIEMRISNDPTFAGAVWEPMAQHKNWRLGEGGGGEYAVYCQFRDAAGNLSFRVLDTINYISLRLYLPMVKK